MIGVSVSCNSINFPIILLLYCSWDGVTVKREDDPYLCELILKKIKRTHFPARD
jgi:hypothetical protein